MAKLLSALLFAALAAAQNTANLTEYLTSQSDLSTLATALSLVPDLAGALPSEGITILAPVDSAFEGLDLAGLTSDLSAVANLLSYHVLNGTYLSTDFDTAPQFLKTLYADVNVTGGQNLGVIRAGEQYLILSGNAATSEVVEPDIEVGNITIHKIDKILSIPLEVSTLAVQAGLYAAAAAITATNLTETVDTTEDLTLFVPTDDAFENIASILTTLNATQVQEVLLYHAVAGSVLFSVDAGNVTVPSAAGANITLSVINGTVFVNSAKVIIPNIITANGVIHVIDSVLNPNEEIDREELDPSASVTAAYPSATSGSVPIASPTGTTATQISIPPVYTTAPAVPTGDATQTGENPTATGGDENVASTYGKGAFASLGLSLVIAAWLML